MKKITKSLSYILAFAMVLATFVLPINYLEKAFAGQTYLASSSLFVGEILDKNVGDEMNFSTVCPAVGAEVKAWGPDKSVAIEWSATSTNFEFYTAGVFALQFRIEENEIYTYSDFYYVNVAADYAEIVIDSMVAPVAKAGTLVTIPTAALFKDDAKQADVIIQVLDNKGNDVDITADRKFTNKTNMLGNYYIKYSCVFEGNVYTDFKTVKFVEDFTIPTDLVIEASKKDNSIFAETKFDTFKTYDVSKVTVVNGDEEVVESEVTFTIFNERTSKYYYYNSGNWEVSDVAQSMNIEDDGLDTFSIDNIDGYTNGLTYDGDSFVFSYTATTCYGTSITKAITKAEQINDDMFSVEVLGQMPSKLDVVVDADTTNTETQSTTIPGLKIVIDDDYNVTAIENLFDLAYGITKSTDTNLTSSLIYNKETGKFSLSYNKEVTSAKSFLLNYYVYYNVKDSEYKSDVQLGDLTINEIVYDDKTFVKSTENNWSVIIGEPQVVYRLEKVGDIYNYYVDEVLTTGDITFSQLAIREFEYVREQKPYTLNYADDRGGWITPTTNSNDSRIMFENEDGTYTIDYYYTAYQNSGVALNGKGTLKISTKTITMDDIDITETKPNDITIDDFQAEYVSDNSVEFVLPDAIAKFFYNFPSGTSDVLNKYSVDVFVDDILMTGVIPGDSITLAPGGIYKITYKFVSNNGGFSTKDFYVEVVPTNSKTIASATLSINAFDLDNYLLAEKSSNFNYAFIIDENGNRVDASYEYTDGYLTKIDFEEEDGVDYAITLVIKGMENNNEYALYKTYYTNENNTNIESNPIEYVDNIDAFVYSLPAVNGTKTISVGDGVYFGANTITTDDIRTIKNVSGNYKVLNEVIYFNTVGIYTFETVSGEYTIVVEDKNEISLIFVNDFTPVAIKNNDIALPMMYVENIFGYSLNSYATRSNGNRILVSDITDISSVDNYTISFVATAPNGKVDSENFDFSTGSIIKPVITILGSIEEVIFNNKTLVYEVKNATAKDQYGNDIANVLVDVYNPNGERLTISDSKIEIDMTGTYTIYYTATDLDGNQTIEKVSFVSRYANNDSEDGGLAWWEILLIVVGSVIGVGLAGGAVWFVIYKQKNKTRFVSKTKKSKKNKKQKSNEIQITIAPSKNGKEWFVKKNNRMFAKCLSKDEAATKAKESFQTNAIIKVYAKSGRLIDTIK